ncbi:MAG: hypothetical protein KKC20_08930 [Proteobacteria bacterium]|nr:hypothetical protein [Pseudomonadota bacterium]
MAIIEKFLGQRVEVPEDLRYHLDQGLWARKTQGAVVFGLAQPAWVLTGGVKDMTFLCNDGGQVKTGESVLFAITKKILYIDAPFGGVIRYNKKAQKASAQTDTDLYGQAWLFMIRPQGDSDAVYLSLSSPGEYLLSLRKTDGFKNPLGLKGGVSGMCKAVYSGIGDQAANRDS